MRKTLPGAVYRCWRRDDPSWMDHRKKEWKEILNEMYRDESAASIAAAKKYFISGAPSDISCQRMVLFTPLQSGEMFRMFILESGVFSPLEIEQLITNHLQNTISANVFSWYPQHTKHYSDAFYSGGFENIVVKDYRGNDCDVSTDASYLFTLYLRQWRLMLTGRILYTGFINFTDYILKTLPLVTDVGRREKIFHSNGLEGVFEAARDVVSSLESTSELRKHAETMLGNEQAIRDGWAINSHLDETR